MSDFIKVKIAADKLIAALSIEPTHAEVEWALRSVAANTPTQRKVRVHVLDDGSPIDGIEKLSEAVLRTSQRGAASADPQIRAGTRAALEFHYRRIRDHLDILDRAERRDELM